MVDAETCGLQVDLASQSIWIDAISGRRLHTDGSTGLSRILHDWPVALLVRAGGQDRRARPQSNVS